MEKNKGEQGIDLPKSGWSLPKSSMLLEYLLECTAGNGQGQISRGALGKRENFQWKPYPSILSFERAAH